MFGAVGDRGSAARWGEERWRVAMLAGNANVISGRSFRRPKRCGTLATHFPEVFLRRPTRSRWSADVVALVLLAITAGGERHRYL